MPEFGNEWDAHIVIAALADAMRTLSALPGGGPSGVMARVRLEVAADEYGGVLPAMTRPPVPAAGKISEMDRILLWMAFIPEEKFVLRRVVAFRAVTHYATHKPMPWKRIGARVGANYLAVQAWHGQGVSLIVRGLNRAGTPAWWRQDEPAQAAPREEEIMAALAPREPVGRRWPGRC